MMKNLQKEKKDDELLDKLIDNIYRLDRDFYRTICTDDFFYFKNLMAERPKLFGLLCENYNVSNTCKVK